MLARNCRRQSELSDLFGGFNDVFNSTLSESPKTYRSFPTVDIHEDETHYYLDADVPGVAKKELSISIDSNVLTLSGSRKDEREEKKSGYFSFERQVGQFERRFDLGDKVDSSKVEASFENGVLNILIPKKNEVISKKREIEIA
jgi:HSP20 family protein